MSRRGAAACWLVAGVAYLGLEFASATGLSGYRYDRDFISDLGRPDSPLHHLMNTAFVVQGTLLCLGAVLLVWGSRDGRLFVGLAAANTIGNLIVAAVPSGGPGVAWVHVIGAVIAIVGGNAAILAGWRFVGATGSYRVVSVGLAALGLLSFAALAVAATTSTTVLLPGAVWERTSVYTIIGWQMLSAGRLLRRTNTAPSR